MSDKDHRSSSLFTSLRRSVVRIAPSALVDEMRPMLQKGRQSPTQHPQQQHPPRTKSRPETTAASNKAAFEISLRDKSDATAKRGFRVQVPKRMLFYTLLVFVGMPLFLFGYVEMHNRSTAAEEHGDHPQKHPHENHQYDKYKVIDAEEEDVEGGEDGGVIEGSTAANATKVTIVPTVEDTEKTAVTTAKDKIAVDSTAGVKTEEATISDVATNATVATKQTTAPDKHDEPKGDENVGQSDTAAPSSNSTTTDSNNEGEVDKAPAAEVTEMKEDPASAKDAAEGERRRRRLRGSFSPSASYG